jgi:EAL domain-containing protein (putative c-di-GMP-specific phosphodiesterase class I)
VQNRAQQDLLQAWGCQQMQGLAIGGPLALPDFEAWVLQGVRPALA